MIMKIFSVFDSKAAFFGNPFFDQNEGSAIRNFSDAVNDSSNPNNMWHKHPEDFSLFYLGEFDNLVGSFSSDIPRCVLTASALRELKADYPDFPNSVDVKNIKKNSKDIHEELIQ